MEEQSKSSRPLQKILYFVLIPLLFLVIIAGVIFVFLGLQDSGSFASAVQNIPVLGSLLDPETKTDANRVEVLEKRLQEMENAYEEKEDELTALQQMLEDNEEEKQDLQDQVVELESEIEEQHLSGAERSQQLQEIADVYAGMSPSQAAGILENLTFQEAALLLEQMKQDEKSRIMAKLNPAFAANVTVVMKEYEQVQDLDQAAMQERINLLMEAVESETGSQISIQQMVDTFTQMSSSRAARILEAMHEGDNNNEFQIGIHILSQVKDSVRSGIIDQMEPNVAVQYVQALMEES